MKRWGALALVTLVGVLARCSSPSVSSGPDAEALDGAAQDGTASCGASGQSCCNSTACNAGLTCSGGTCAGTQADSGAALDSGTNDAASDTSVTPVDSSAPADSGALDTGAVDAGCVDGSADAGQCFLYPSCTNAGDPGALCDQYGFIGYQLYYCSATPPAPPQEVCEQVNTNQRLDEWCCSGPWCCVQ